MKTLFSFSFFFIFLVFSAQQVVYKDALKKCRKEFSKKICLSDDDKDGILFYLDKCPESDGAIENDGCPWPDVDADGLIDKDDACPMIAGPAENNGCPWPDTDGDGVLDKDDSCPTIAGILEKNGCRGKDCNKFYEEEQERLKKFQNESKNVNYNSLPAKIIDGIDLSLIKEEIVLILVRDELVICGNETSCYHSYNYESPVFSSDDFWNKKTIAKVFERLNKKVIFGSRQFGAGFSLNFEDFSYANAKRNIVEFEYFEQKFEAPIFSKKAQKSKVSDNYNTFTITISNSLGNIINVAYRYEYFVNKKRWDNFIFRELEKLTVVKVFQYINNQWKLIETTKQN